MSLKKHLSFGGKQTNVLPPNPSLQPKEEWDSQGAGQINAGSAQDAVATHGRPARLTVRVMKAMDLVAKDRGGTSDPLAQLLLGSQKHETKVITKTLNPTWDEEFSLDFRPGSGEQLDVVLYDHDKGLLTNSKEFLGSVTIFLDHIMPDMAFQEWHELEWNPKYQKKKEDVTGKVLLDISWSEPEDALVSEPGQVAPFPSQLQKRNSRANTARSELPDLPEDSELDSRPQTAIVKRRAIVHILQGEDLTPKDKSGFSDPFAVVYVGTQKETTKHVSQTLNPTWDETFYFDVPEGQEHVEIVVYDHDKGFLSNSQEYMGSTIVSLSDITPGTVAQSLWCELAFDKKWNKKEEPVTGRIQIEVEMVEESVRPESQWRQQQLRVDTYLHKLTFTVLRAEGLVAKDKGGTSDPFVELIIDKQKFKTKVIPKTLNPEWNEAFAYDIDMAGSKLDIVVYDHDKGLLGSSSEYLGSVTISLQFAENGEQWHTLEWDSRFQKKKEEVTGRILIDIQGLDSDESGIGDGDTGTPQMNRSLSRSLSQNLHLPGTPNSIATAQARVVQITIAKGASLIAKDSSNTSDPFVEAKLGKQRYKSKTVKKTLNPEWNETLQFDYLESTSDLALVVYDEDMGFMGSTAEYMGSCIINLAEFQSEEEVSDWYPLTFDKQYSKTVETITGRLLVKIKIKLDLATGVDVSSLARPPRNERKALQNKDKGVGWLEVTVISADRITAADRGGTSDPFFVLVCGSRKEQTKTKLKTLKPFWNEAFAFEVPPGESGFEMNLYDENKLASNTFLGSIIIKLDDLPENEDVVQAFGLRTRGLDPSRDPDHVSGSVKLLLNYFSKGDNVVQIPTYDAEKAEAKYRETGTGACTLCVVCAVSLPLADPKNGAISSYVEIIAGESRTNTKVLEGRNPVWNAPFMLELTPNAQVCQLVLKAKPSKLNVSKGDTIIGIATILLAGLPPGLTTSWHELIPVKAEFGIRASIKVTANPHIIPELALNYPRREVATIRDNASRGLGTLEIVIVAGKELPGDPMNGTRTAVVKVTAGNRRGTIDDALQGLNPVWNKPLTLEIDPDVVSLKCNVIDKAPSSNIHKFIGDLTIYFDDWTEGDEIDGWYALTDQDGQPTNAMVRVWGCYVRKISFIDPAERGIIQGAIGDLEVVCIAARGVGIPQLRRPGTASSPSVPGSPATKGSMLSSSPSFKGPVNLTRQASVASFKSGSESRRNLMEEGDDEVDSRFILEKGTMLRCEARIGVMKRLSQQSKAAPNPYWNETLYLKVPHPTAILLASVVVESAGEVDSEPWATAQIPLANLKDDEAVDSWYPLTVRRKNRSSPQLSQSMYSAVSPLPGSSEAPSPFLGARVQSPSMKGGSFIMKGGSFIGQPAQLGNSFESEEEGEEVIVGSVQLCLKIKRNYGFNLELLGGLVSCPWRCGTSFAHDDAAAHFIICPLAPDPTVQVCCIHLDLGCKFRGPRFGMKDHLLVCPYEPVKEVVRGYVKEIRELRFSLQMQDDEIANLRTKLADLERSKEGVPAIGQEAHDRYTLERYKKDLADPQQDPQKGTGVIELDTAVETMQRKIIKWTPNTNTVTLEGHTDGVACLAHSVEYKKLFSGSLDRSIRVWDLSFHEPLCDGELKGHRGGITGMAISKQKLVSGSADMTVRVWDLLQMREETKLAGHSGPIHGLILLNDMCLTVSQDKSIKIWDIRAGELVTSIETKSRGQYGMAIHELKLISASGSKIYTWDLRKVASSTMNEQQRMEFGRFDTLTGNASGVFGHQMVGDRLYTSAGRDK